MKIAPNYKSNMKKILSYYRIVATLIIYSLVFVLYLYPSIWEKFVIFLDNHVHFIMPFIVIFLDAWFYLSARRHVNRLNRSFSKIISVRLLLESNIFFSANIMAGIYIYNNINKWLKPFDDGNVFSQFSVLFIVLFLYHAQFMTSRSLRGLNYKKITSNIKKYEKD